MGTSDSITPSGKGPVLKIRTKSTSVDDFVQRHARDFSPQGVFVMTRRPLDVGAPLGVEFQLVDEQPVFSCRGVVAWKREPSDDLNRTAGMGVAFAQLHADAADLLTRLTRQRAAVPSRFEEEEPGSTPGNVAPGSVAPVHVAARTTTRPARGLWSAAGNSPLPPATDTPHAPDAGEAAGKLRASQLFSSPDLAPAPRAEAVEVAPSVEPMSSASLVTPSFSELEPDTDAPAAEQAPGGSGVLELPDLPSSGGVVAKDTPRSSDPARAERFSKLIRALRSVSTPPDEPTPHGPALLVSLILAGGLIAFTLYLSGSGMFAPLMHTLVRGLRSLAAHLGL